MEAFAKDITFPFTRVTVGTAHPAKFADSVEQILHSNIQMPEPLATAMQKKKRVHVMGPTLSDLSSYLDVHA